MPESRIRILGLKDRGNGRHTVYYLVFAPCFCTWQRCFDQFEYKPTETEIKNTIIARHGNIY